ncbi:tRNA synthetase class I [Astrocystis sublimbata]|nr:tRNA synthetase class I [Astrocystis sublimbata]
MSSRFLRTASSAARMTLCRSCFLRSMAASRQQRRPLHLGTIEKRRHADEAWAEKAKRIERGEERHLWDSFRERGFVKDTAGTDDQIRELMLRKRIGAYVGIDPTASSLHLGHLLPLMPLFWMYMHGFRAITVLGGATAKVGDPTGRLKTRDETPRADRTMYVTKMHYQLKRMWMNVDAQARRYGFEKEWAWNRELCNNSAWYNTTTFIEVVNRLFKGMRVGTMLSRETVKRKMSEGDGISLAEFVYPMMQAWDWWKMFSGPKGVCMQIGGSDQYGNIVAGIDAVKLLRDTDTDVQRKIPADLLNTPVGFTVPLLTDSAGNKFGKSAGNAMWLDPFQTSSFDLYGYFMRRPDDEVEKLLKLFTFLPLEQIAKVMEEHNLDPPKRHAHHTLAFEVLALVHSFEQAGITREQHKQMFSKGTTLLINETPTLTPALSTAEEELGTYPDRTTPPTIGRALSFRPDIQLPESLIMGKGIARILHAAGLAESANAAHRLVAHQGAYVGGAPGRSAHHGNTVMAEGELTFTPVKHWFPADTKNFLIDGKLLILRRGKHFIRIVEMVSDEDWASSGRAYAGEQGKGQVRQLRQLLKETGGSTKRRFSRHEMESAGEELSRIRHERNNALPDDPTTGKIIFPRKHVVKLPRADQYKRPEWQSETKGSVEQRTAAIDNFLAYEKSARLQRAEGRSRYNEAETADFEKRFQRKI